MSQAKYFSALCCGLALLVGVSCIPKKSQYRSFSSSDAQNAPGPACEVGGQQRQYPMKFNSPLELRNHLLDVLGIKPPQGSQSPENADVNGVSRRDFLKLFGAAAVATTLIFYLPNFDKPAFAEGDTGFSPRVQCGFPLFPYFTGISNQTELLTRSRDIQDLPPEGTWSYFEKFFYTYYLTNKKAERNKFLEMLILQEEQALGRVYSYERRDPNASNVWPEYTLVDFVAFGRSLARLAQKYPLTQPRLITSFNSFKHGGYINPEGTSAANNPSQYAQSGFRGRLKTWIGYVAGHSSMEVISYNPLAGRFEFMLVEGWPDEPSLRFANRSLCASCHFQETPIFPTVFWNEIGSGGESQDGRKKPDAMGSIFSHSFDQWSLRRSIGPEKEKFMVPLEQGFRSDDLKRKYETGQIEGIIPGRFAPEDAPVQHEPELIGRFYQVGVQESQDMNYVQILWKHGCSYGLIPLPKKYNSEEKLAARYCHLIATKFMFGAADPESPKVKDLGPIPQRLLKPYIPPFRSLVSVDRASSAQKSVFSYDALKPENTERNGGFCEDSGQTLRPLCIPSSRVGGLSSETFLANTVGTTVQEEFSGELAKPRNAIALDRVTHIGVTLPDLKSIDDSKLSDSELQNSPWLATFLDSPAFDVHKFYALDASNRTDQNQKKLIEFFGEPPRPEYFTRNFSTPMIPADLSDPSLNYFYGFCSACHSYGSLAFLSGRTQTEVKKKMRSIKEKILMRIDYANSHEGFTMPPIASGGLRQLLYGQPETVKKMQDYVRGL